MTRPRVVPSDVRSHCVVLTGVTLLVLLGIATAPAAAQESACGTILDNATGTTTGPGGQLADAIGNQGSDIGDELNDRWVEARLENASSDAARADILAAEADRIEARLNLTEQCLGTGQPTDGSDPTTRELTPRQVDALEREIRTLHRRINVTRNRSAEFSSFMRARHDIEPERFSALERRVIAARESVAARQ